MGGRGDEDQEAVMGEAVAVAGFVAIMAAMFFAWRRFVEKPSDDENDKDWP